MLKSLEQHLQKAWPSPSRELWITGNFCEYSTRYFCETGFFFRKAHFGDSCFVRLEEISMKKEPASTAELAALAHVVRYAVQWLDCKQRVHACAVYICTHVDRTGERSHRHCVHSEPREENTLNRYPTSCVHVRAFVKWHWLYFSIASDRSKCADRTRKCLCITKLIQ